MLILSIPIIIFLIVFAPYELHAYIDPGTGSYIFQIVIALILGMGYALKLYWRKIINLFSSKKTKNKHNDKNK